MSAQFWVGPVNDPDRIWLGPPVASGAEGVLYRGYLAVDGGTLPLAVKMLQPAHLDNLAGWTARWRTQVDLLRSVRMPGLVGVRGGFVGPLPHEQGRADAGTTSLYLLMDWVDGVSLDRWAASVRDAQPEELLLTLVPVAAALDLLHSGAATGGVSVVHRDVKPANILMGSEGATCLVDVGSVRGMASDPGHPALMGTVGYLAPEVLRDGIVGPAADRYALGAVAYFLLTGCDPPVDAGVDELRASLSEAPLLRQRPELVDHVVAMLDPDPAQRPTGLANWVAQLRRSSLVSLPGGVPLAPRAPARQPRVAGQQVKDGRGTGRRRARRRRIGAVALAAAGAAAVVMVALPDADRPVPRQGAVDGSAPATVTATTTRPVPPRVDLRDGGAPPWAEPAVSAGHARDVVLAEWTKAGNRAGSRAILPADVALAPAATARAANFSDGWAVAWDDPGAPGLGLNGTPCGDCGRGVSGIAGSTTVVTADAIASRWPNVVRWSDGTVLGYGWEGHDPITGNMLAEIAMAGQRFGYSLWSRLGEDHLRYLISQLRFVAGAP